MRVLASPSHPPQKKALRSAPADVDGGAAGAVYHGCPHTRVVAGGLAASSPLTWHVLLRFAGAGRDHVEDLGGAPVGRAVGSLGDAVGQLRPRRAGDVLSFIHDVSFSLRCSGVLAFKSWSEKKYVSFEPPLFFFPFFFAAKLFVRWRENVALRRRAASLCSLREAEVANIVFRTFPRKADEGKTGNRFQKRR